MQLKELKPIKPVKVLGFKLGDTHEGLAEALTQLIGQLPIIVSEMPVTHEQGGIQISLIHQTIGWNLVAKTGDWIVAGEDGNVEVYEASIEEHFTFTDVLPKEPVLKLV